MAKVGGYDVACRSKAEIDHIELPPLKQSLAASGTLSVMFQQSDEHDGIPLI